MFLSLCCVQSFRGLPEKEPRRTKNLHIVEIPNQRNADIEEKKSPGRIISNPIGYGNGGNCYGRSVARLRLFGVDDEGQCTLSCVFQSSSCEFWKEEY